MSDRGGGALTRDVILRISAQNLSTADFRAATAAVNELTAAVDKQIEAAAKGTVKEKELTEALSKLNDAGKSFTGFARIIENLKGLDIQIAAQIKRVAEAKEAWDKQQAAVDANDNATKKELSRLAGLKTGHENAVKALNGQIERQKAYRDELEKNGLDAQNLANAERQLLAVVDQAGLAVNKLTQARDNYAKILRQTKEEELKNIQVQEAATKAAQERAAAEREVAHALEQAQQRMFARDREISRAEVGTGAQAHLAALAAERKAEQDRIAAERAAEIERGRIRQAANEIALSLQRQRNEARRKAEEEGSRQAVEAERARQAELARVRQEADEKARAAEAAALSRFDRFREQRMRGRTQERQSVDDLARTEARAAQNRSRTGQQPGFLGLRSYEITNLGYQATDILQGFASGVSPATILAQQGPQVFQIFGLAALKWLPVVAVAAGAVTVAIGAMATALRQITAERQFSAAIAANIDLVRYNAKQLVEYQKNIQDMGVSWADAGKAIRTAMSQNIASDRITQLAQTAKDVSRITGDEVPDAMKKLVTGFTNGEKGIKELNQELGFLNDKDLEHIETLYKHGKAVEAIDFAYGKLATRYKNAAEIATTPFQKSVESLTVSWNELLRTLSDSETINKLIGLLTRFVNLLDQGVQAIDRMIERQKELKFAPTSEAAAEQQRMLEDAAAGRMPTAPRPSGVVPIPGGLATGNARVQTGTLKVDTTELRDLVAALNEASKGLPEGYQLRVADPSLHNKYVAGSNPPRISEHYMRRALDVAVLDEAGNVVPGYMRRGGPLYEQIDAAVAKYVQENKLGPLAIGTYFPNKPDAGHFSLRGPEAESAEITRGMPGVRAQQMQAEATRKERDAAKDASRDAREAYALEQARNREEAARLERIKVERDIRAQFPNLTPAEQARMAAEKMAPFLLKQRIEATREQQDIEQKLLQTRTHAAEAEAARQKAIAEATKNNITNYNQLKEIGDRAAATEEARLSAIDQENDRYKSLVKVVDDLERGLNKTQKTELAKQLEEIELRYKNIREQFERGRREAPLTGAARITELEQRLGPLQARESFDVRRKAAEDSAKAALQTRDELIRSYDRLYEMGEVTLEEKQKKTKEAIEAATPALLEQADALEKWVEEARKAGNIPASVLDKATASAKEFRAETKYIDPFWKGLKTTIEDSFGTNLTEAFNTVAEAVGKAVTKTGEWKDVLVSLKTAAGSFFAGILKDIAAYIIKVEALKLLQSAGLSLPGLGLGGVTTAATGTAATTGMSSGWSSILSGAAAVAHAGGTVGVTQFPTRPAPASWFDRAPRYHTGAVVGLAANEQTAILQRGEEVLTRDSPRNAMNLRGGGGGEIKIRSVLVADPDMVPSAMSGSMGERVVVQHLVKNAATVRQIVRG